MLSEEEEIVEVDYADLGKLISEIEVAATSSNKTKTTTLAAATVTTGIATSVQKDENQSVVTTAEGVPPGFYIDTKPSPVHDSPTTTNNIAVEHPSTGILGEDIAEDDDDEIIVYVAPHPRNSKLASAHNQTSPDEKTLPPAAATDPVAAPAHQHTNDAPHTPVPAPKPEPEIWPEPVSQPVPKDAVIPTSSLAPAPAIAFKDFSFSLLSSSPKPAHRGRWSRPIARRKAERNAMFSLRGAMRAEASLRERDLRRAEQRRGDSDVDWGDSTSGIAEAEGSEEGGGMLVDRHIPVDAMASFVRSMSIAGQAHVSAGDLEDETRIRLEDAEEGTEDNESASDGDEDVEEELELADGTRGILAADDVDEDEMASRSSSADDDDDDSSEDEDETPRRSFHARLERIRSRTAGQPIKDMTREELDRDRELDEDLNSDSDSNIDDEDDIIARMEVLDFLPYPEW